MTTLPTSRDLMPADRPAPGEGQLLDPDFVIAMALSTIPYRWSGKLLDVTSQPVRAVRMALDKAGYEIKPKDGS
jgi:hypothetical protein